MIWNYLGFQRTSPTPTKSAVRALPASWYSSEELYQLERRAIFSKRWLLVSHKLRFTNAGDWIRFEEADFQFIVCRDRDGNINAFHNVCRHRGFPIVTKDQGQSKILSCGYHGWSYGLNGKLTKAPGYQEMGGFDTAKNGLFPIHVHVDHKGFIWVNLDAAEKPEVAWSDDFDGVDLQDRFDGFNFEEYTYDHTWQQSGDYNWKTLADNYNECYHCPMAHPDTVGWTDLTLYSVDTIGGYIKHHAYTKEEKVKEGMEIASTFYFPNACMTVSPNFFYMMRCVPTAPNHCSMEYDVFRHKDATDQDFEKIDSAFKRILGEDKWLCNSTQKNLDAGVFVNGEMHSRMERGPLYLQNKVREILQSHRKQEDALKREIWPARQISPANNTISKSDEEFCGSLSCDAYSKDIQW